MRACVVHKCVRVLHVLHVLHVSHVLHVCVCGIFQVAVVLRPTELSDDRLLLSIGLDRWYQHHQTLYPTKITLPHHHTIALSLHQSITE